MDTKRRPEWDEMSIGGLVAEEKTERTYPSDNDVVGSADLAHIG